MPCLAHVRALASMLVRFGLGDILRAHATVFEMYSFALPGFGPDVRQACHCRECVSAYSDSVMSEPRATRRFMA